MAIYHLSMQIAKRNNGKRSLIAMAAYRSGERLYSELYDKVNHYKHRQVKPDSFILIPESVPQKFLDREYLWNSLELAEKQPNARLCREVNIALPIELTEDEQKELIKEFVEESFISRNMIADVSIHRDNENNPHAHIMLSMREIDSNGNILNKRIRKPKLDINGEQIYNEKGQRVTVSLKTNDWDKKDLILSVRKNWADKINFAFAEKGISQRVSEKSFSELGKSELPTIHEGYYTKNLEKQGVTTNIKKKNMEIHIYNQTVQQINELEEKRELLKEDKNYEINFNKIFSPMEKKALKELSSELKMFVSDDSVSKRLEELKRWENSIIFNNKSELENQRLQLDKLADEREKLLKADEILIKQAKRFVDKAYPGIDTNKFDNHSIKAIANETVAKHRKLTKEEMIEAVYRDKIIVLEKEKKIFKEKPFQTVRFINKKISNLEAQLSKEPRTDNQEILKEKINQMEKVKQGLHNYIEAEVKDRFSADIKLKNVLEGEMLLAKADYYQTTQIDNNELNFRFSSIEINRMLEQSTGYFNSIEQFEKMSDCHAVYFIQEAVNQTEELSGLARKRLSSMVSKNQYLIPQDKKMIYQKINLESEDDIKIDNDGKIQYKEPKLFSLAQSIGKLLQGNNQKKQRNLAKLIRETKSKERKPGNYPSL
ncbi:MobQ family relaxase [Vagococcus fluvialis]|uniref:MobQ family relaxase n=1 Tax=Vagococcus fluvialis TaxID=2738 RepID=UPI0037B5CD82